MIPSLFALALSANALSDISDLENGQQPKKKAFPFQSYAEAKKLQWLFIAVTVISACTLLIGLSLLLLPGSRKLTTVYVGFEGVSFIALLSIVLLFVKQSAQVGDRTADIALVVVLTIATGAFYGYSVFILQKSFRRASR